MLCHHHEQVADTIHKTVFAEMLEPTCNSLETACYEASRTVMFNPLPMCQTPVVLERFYLRMLPYRAFLGMVTIGIELRVPTVSVTSILELLDGRAVQDSGDLTAIKTFVQYCWDEKMFINAGCLGGGGGVPGKPGSNPIPFITNRGDWELPLGNLRQKISVGQQEKAPGTEIRNLLGKGLYHALRHILEPCGFCKSAQSFNQCIDALEHHLDWSRFFGGMSMYHNTRGILQNLGMPFAQSFPENYGTNASAAAVSGNTTAPDRCLEVAQLDSDVYSLTVRIWDVLLWFAIMRRPRRDYSVMEVRWILPVMLHGLGVPRTH